jgi:hypothetical protein
VHDLLQTPEGRLGRGRVDVERARAIEPEDGVPGRVFMHARDESAFRARRQHAW